MTHFIVVWCFQIQFETLKSCEIPLGFFNIRVASEFVFTTSHRDIDKPMTYGDLTFTPVNNAIELLSKPKAQNSYFFERH